MRLDELRRCEDAVVWKAGVPAARLLRERDGTVFSYLPDYAGASVATTLPRGADPVRCAGGAVPPFFSGLLPEGRRLGALRRAVKTSADDELTLLLAVGADAVGDVQVLPPDVRPVDAAVPNASVAASEDVVFAELFEAVLAPEPSERVAIAGAQDKITGRMISLPVSHRGSACILKLDPPEFRHLVANEAFFVAAARSSGLDTVDAVVVRDRLGCPGLLVRRFDRAPVRGAEALVPLAQEDACQVSGRYPADKYRLTAEDVVDALCRPCGAPVVAARNLLKQFVFAYLTGNGDAHGKNFSILRRGGEWMIAPAYDLPSTLPYVDTSMALSIGGKDREHLGRRDFVALAARGGLPEKAAARIIDEIVAAASSWIERLGELPFDERTVHKVERACRYRANRLSG
jgi:serine/threonine-protein kinase HipA